MLSLHSLSGLCGQELVSQLLQAVYVGCEACAKPLTQVRECTAHLQWNLIFRAPCNRDVSIHIYMYSSHILYTANHEHLDTSPIRTISSVPSVFVFERASHIHLNACSLGVQDVNHVYCPCADCVMKTPGGVIHTCTCTCIPVTCTCMYVCV